MVPQNHPLIPPKNLEAEASGLLDRVLSVLQENSRSVQISQLHYGPTNLDTAMPSLLMLL